MTAAGRVLVLNKNWQPVNVLPVLDAVNKVFKGRAMFLDIETYGTYDFESWVENWNDAKQTAEVASTQAMRIHGNLWLHLPEVIVCTEYRGFGYKVNHRRPKFSRTNVYRRDRNTCQFCGKKFQTEDLTLDHVVPKSKGGQMTWTNIVLACTPCNNKKGNKTLAEAKLKLIRQPFQPSAEDLKRSPIERIMYKVGTKPPKIWQQFLGKMTVDKAMSALYWNISLTED